MSEERKSLKLRVAQGRLPPKSYRVPVSATVQSILEMLDTPWLEDSEGCRLHHALELRALDPNSAGEIVLSAAERVHAPSPPEVTAALDAAGGGAVGSESPLQRFLRLLKAAGLSEPNPKVVEMVRKSATYNALLNSVGTPDEAIMFYSELTEVPRTETRAAVLAGQGIAIDGPFSGVTGISRSNLFTAFREGRPHVLKVPIESRDFAREAEVVAALGTLPPDCPLVPVETIFLDKKSAHLRSTDPKDVTRVDEVPLRQGFLMPQLAATCSQLAQASPIPADRLCAYGKRILAALDYMHSKGYAHCDVKPSNMLLDWEGRVFLSDFGSAHKLREELFGAGTPHYQPDGVSVYATGVLDRACLVASLLEMHGRRLPTSDLTLDWLRAEAMTTAAPLRSFLTSALDTQDKEG